MQQAMVEVSDLGIGSRACGMSQGLSKLLTLPLVAGNEVMDKKMESTIAVYIRITIRMQSFLEACFFFKKNRKIVFRIVKHLLRFCL